MTAIPEDIRELVDDLFKTYGNGSHPGLLFGAVCGLVLSERNDTRWQPIETAPKDGTVLDLWARREQTDKYERLADCHWCGMTDWLGNEYDGWDGLSPGLHRTYDNPTHWMPLPEPPIATAIRKEKT